MSHSTNQPDFTIPCSRIAKRGYAACAFLMLSASMMPGALYADVQSDDNVKDGPSNQESTATETAEPSSNLQPVDKQCPATDPKCQPDLMPESELGTGVKLDGCPATDPKCQPDSVSESGSGATQQCPATDPKCKRNLPPPSEE